MERAPGIREGSFPAGALASYPLNYQHHMIERIHSCVSDSGPDNDGVVTTLPLDNLGRGSVGWWQYGPENTFLGSICSIHQVYKNKMII